MLTSESRSAADTAVDVAPIVPAVVMWGPTASGKTTIAARLADAAVLHHLTEDNTTAHRNQLADLRLLDSMSRCTRPVVVESAAIPGLLPVDNTAFIVHLDASTPVRARRVQCKTAGLSHEFAVRQVEANDAAMCVNLRASWGIDISHAVSRRWRADLVIGCPDQRECRDELDCTDAVTELVTSAYTVYERYFTTAPDPRHAVAKFDEARRRFPTHVRRISLALCNPDEVTTSAWRGRVARELEQWEGLR